MARFELQSLAICQSVQTPEGAGAVTLNGVMDRALLPQPWPEAIGVELYIAVYSEPSDDEFLLSLTWDGPAGFQSVMKSNVRLGPGGLLAARCPAHIQRSLGAGTYTLTVELGGQVLGRPRLVLGTA